jgi:hypothetical protein
MSRCRAVPGACAMTTDGGKNQDTYEMRVNLYDSGEHTLEGGNIQVRRTR